MSERRVNESDTERGQFAEDEDERDYIDIADTASNLIRLQGSRIHGALIFLKPRRSTASQTS